MALFMVDRTGEAGLLEIDELDDSFEPLTTQYGPDDSEDDEPSKQTQCDDVVEENDVDEICDYGGSNRLSISFNSVWLINLLLFKFQVCRRHPLTYLTF